MVLVKTLSYKAARLGKSPDERALDSMKYRG